MLRRNAGVSFAESTPAAGLDEPRRGKLARPSYELGELIKSAAAAYVRDVQNGTFPSDSESFR